MSQLQHVVLDPAIRDWVLLPLTGIVILVFLARTLGMQYLQATKDIARVELQHKSLLARSIRLRTFGSFIEPSSFNMRKRVLGESDGAYLRESDPETAAADPMAMMKGMGSQPVMMVSTMGLGYLINTLFSGFVLVRVPFALTSRFRAMTQRDLDLLWLDPSYVSSFSWYILCMYGARPLLALLMGLQHSEALQEAQQLQQQQAAVAAIGGGNLMAPFNAKQAFATELQHLSLAEYKTSHTLQAIRETLKTTPKPPKKSTQIATKTTLAARRSRERTLMN